MGGEGKGWSVQHQCVMNDDSLKNIPKVITLISVIKMAHLSHRRSIFSGERQAHIGLHTSEVGTLANVTVFSEHKLVQREPSTIHIIVN